MPTLDTDLSLLRRFSQSGDPMAFAEIIQRYAGMVYSACHRVVHDSARAEDISQETFFRLMRRPDAVSHSLGAWLHTAATNLAVDSLRSDTARVRREQEYAQARLAEQAQAGHAETTWAEVSPHIDTALQSLPDDARELLIAHFLQGKTQLELASEMHTSAATLSRRMHAAVVALQAKLRNLGLSVTPLLLINLMNDHVIRTVPASLGTELGKMTMMTTARAVRPARFIGARPSLLRILTAVLAASVAAGILAAFLGRHVRSDSPSSRSDESQMTVDV
jgi:RNA polymerase sigma-70 factor (ECF subfamily)